MYLYLKRATRPNWLGQMIYQLIAYLETTDEERRIIRAHSLADKVAYCVDLSHVDACERRADAAWERQKKLSVFKQDDVSKIFWENAKVVALSLRASYALHSAFKLSIDDLLKGTVIEGTLEEVLGVESALIKSFDLLKRLTDQASAFDQKTETLLEPDGDAEDHLAPPATWRRYTRS
jgi:hypothetical protein